MLFFPNGRIQHRDVKKLKKGCTAGILRTEAPVSVAPEFFFLVLASHRKHCDTPDNVLNCYARKKTR